MTIHEDLTVTSVADLSALLKSSVVFRNCTLDGADFAEFDAEEMNFEKCTFKKADFSFVVCQSLRITNSNLENARFIKADLQEAVFLNCVFTQADFRNAKLNLSRIAECDLSLCRVEGANLFSVDASGSRFSPHFPDEPRERVVIGKNATHVSRIHEHYG